MRKSTLSDIPSRSLLSRITDHYMQILANQAPIGFEAEFVNQRGATILYRGILLPFSSDGEAIDFIYGVINWKEMADQMTTDELMLEIDQALEHRMTKDAPSRLDDPAGDRLGRWPGCHRCQRPRRRRIGRRRRRRHRRQPRLPPRGRRRRKIDGPIE